MAIPPLTDRIVIATHNEGKWREFATLLGSYIKHVASGAQLGLDSPPETGDSFAANALIKARAAALATGSVALADDSGLCVDGLGGQPGIFSARWGNGSDFSGAMGRIQTELGRNPNRTASFVCVLALVWPNGYSETVEGRCEGVIAPTPRGTYGHGYDPIFIPHDENRSFAEMSEDEKNKISHRGKATRALVEKFFAA
jgi:XTP/dITP diphosphohydrolase